MRAGTGAAAALTSSDCRPVKARAYARTKRDRQGGICGSCQGASSVASLQKAGWWEGSRSPQLRRISASIIAQELAALQGGWVAGETCVHWATRRAASWAPRVSAQLRAALAISSVADLRKS